MAYKVIKGFVDSKDHYRYYATGDTYPVSGITVDDARIEELASDRNKAGEPLIVKVAETKASPKKEEPKAEKVEEVEVEKAEVQEEKKAKKTTSKPKSKKAKE